MEISAHPLAFIVLVQTMDLIKKTGKEAADCGFAETLG
jgi:hypothetical protein